MHGVVTSAPKGLSAEGTAILFLSLSGGPVAELRNQNFHHTPRLSLLVHFKG